MSLIDPQHTPPQQVSQQQMPQQKVQGKAVFFDRDGVLNIDHGYTHRVEDCALIDGAAEAVRMVNDHGYLAFVVTNQGGIALGLYSEADMQAFHQHLFQRIHDASGGVITDTRFCPHHPKSEDPSLQDCTCRKPSPKMILDLAQQHNIDLSQSVMIGDRDTDVEAGQSAGCQTVFFKGGRLDDALKPLISTIEG